MTGRCDTTGIFPTVQTPAILETVPREVVNLGRLRANDIYDIKPRSPATIQTP